MALNLGPFSKKKKEKEKKRKRRLLLFIFIPLSVLAIGAGVAIPFLIKKKTTSPDESPASVRPKLPKNSYYFDQLGNDVPYGSYYCVFPKPVGESDFSSSVKQAQTACIKFSYDIGGDHRHGEICYDYNPAPGKSHEGIIVTYGANSSDTTYSMDITGFNDGSGIHFDVAGGSETTTCYYDVVRGNGPISDRDLKLEYFNGQPSNHSSKFNTGGNLCYLSETQPT